MRFSIPPSYAEFFSIHNVLELEEILPEGQADLLCHKLENLVDVHSSPTNLELWKSGKNLWKQDPEIKKILAGLRLGEIAHTLFKTRMIRMAFTQTLFTETAQDLVFSEALSLSEISSVTPLLGGVCLRLSPPATNQEEKLLPDLLNQKRLSALFFSADYKIPFQELFKQKQARYLFICFSRQGLRYKLEAKDPFTHDLKKEGYVFGDLISEELAPYLHR